MKYYRPLGAAITDIEGTLNGQTAKRRNGFWSYENSGTWFRVTDPKTASQLDLAHDPEPYPRYLLPEETAPWYALPV